MKSQSWLSTCSSSTCISTNPTAKPGISPINRTQLQISDHTSTYSEGQITSTSITQYSNLESNLSLLTLPSVPSLQKLSPESFKFSTLCLTTLKSRPFHINCLSVHNNLLYAVSGNEINVYNLLTFSISDTFNVHDPSSGFIKSIVFLDDKIFTAHQDCKIRVWKISADNQHKHIATLPTLEDRLRKFIFPKNYIKVWRHKKRLWVEHFDAVSGLAAGEDLIYSISWDKYLKSWNAPNFGCGVSIKAHDDAINAVVVSPADGMIYTGSADKRIKVWGKPFGERKLVLIATLEKHKSAVNALAVNSDGSVLFSGACDRSILVWEREDSANHMVVTGALRGHSKAILCLINVSDLLFSGSADRTVRIWKRGNQGRFCCLTVLDGHAAPVRSLVAVPEMEKSCGAIKVISGSFDGEIKVWMVMMSSVIT